MKLHRGSLVVIPTSLKMRKAKLLIRIMRQCNRCIRESIMRKRLLLIFRNSTSESSRSLLTQFKRCVTTSKLARNAESSFGTFFW